MPAPPVMLSDTELYSIQDSITHGVRLDGRQLLQHRPIVVSTGDCSRNESQLNDRSDPGETDSVTLQSAVESSVAEVRIGETHVVATASPTVFRDENWLDAFEEEDECEDGSKDDGRGILDITLDAVPSVVQRYSMAVLGGATSGGRATRRAQRLFLSMIALTMRDVYGASRVRILDNTLADGVAEAQEVGSDVGEDEGTNDDSPSGTHKARSDRRGAKFSAMPRSTGFPAQDLYIGKGFAFKICVDVHILEGGGGNLLTAVSSAVYASLQRIVLPLVTLHKGPQGILAEVDRRQIFAKRVDFSRLSRLVVLGISPTRHYVVDPNWEEEIALPQQLHIAADAEGRVTYSRYQQWPSRRGSRRLVQEIVPMNPPSPNYKRQREDEATDNEPEKTFSHTMTRIHPARLSVGQPADSSDTSGSINDDKCCPSWFPLSVTDYLSAMVDATHIISSLDKV